MHSIYIYVPCIYMYYNTQYIYIYIHTYIHLYTRYIYIYIYNIIKPSPKNGKFVCGSLSLQFFHRYPNHLIHHKARRINLRHWQRQLRCSFQTLNEQCSRPMSYYVILLNTAWSGWLIGTKNWMPTKGTPSHRVSTCLGAASFRCFKDLEVVKKYL